YRPTVKSENPSLSIGEIASDNTSPTQDPEPSQPSPHMVEHVLESTADGEPKPRATETSASGATELRITL
ncbi:hypothetical protein M9458_036758, partial [Cirrhinus mrigala]